MKNFLKKIGLFLKRLIGKGKIIYNDLTDHSKKVIAFGVELTEAVKSVTDTQVDDAVALVLSRLMPKYSSIILGAQEYLEDNIPKWLTTLKAAQTVAGIADSKERTKAIMIALNVSEDNSEDYLYLASKASYYMQGGEDGEFNFADIKGLAQECYDFLKKENKL